MKDNLIHLMMKRYFLSLFAVAGILASCAKDPAVSGTAPGGGNERNEEEYVGDVVKGKIRIRLADNATALRTGAFTRGEADSGDPELDKLAAQLGATKIERVFGTDPRFTERHKKYGLHLWYDVTFDEDVPVSRAQSGFESLPGVAYVRPIYRIYPADGYDTLYPAAVTDKSGWEGSTAEMPFDDPGLPMQWHYYNDGTLFNTEGTVVAVEGADVNLFKAWEMYGAGDPSVVVAVMDMGIQYDHPDLVANMWVNEGELNGEPNKDNDGNGIKNDIYGYNGLTRDGNIEPGSHGTHVAGTVAATNNNGIGVSGVAGGTGVGDGARLMSCQIFAPNDASESDYPDVYRYAADNGAVISQNSWGYSQMYSAIPEDMAVAMDYFIDNAGIGPDGEQTGPMKGGIIIFSASNDYSSRPSFPGADDRVVCVTSMMPNYMKAGYSNFGDAADIFAPGGAGSTDTEFSMEGQVYSTDITDAYGYKAGTSMACPHVSGIAALIVSRYGVGQPGFTPDKLREILLRSYRSVGQYQKTPAIADGLGVGLVDATMIELENPGTAPEAPQAVSAEGTDERKLTLRITASADGNGMSVAQYRVSYAPEGTADGADGWQSVELYNRADIGEVSEYTVGNLEHETTYVFRVKSVDRFGNESAGYTEGRGTTVEHTNLSPEITKPLGRVVLPSGNSFTATVDLNENFSDPDLPNDELTFTAESNDASVATAQVLEGGILEVTGLKKGDTFISVTVKDREGLSISKNMGVSVTADPAGSGEGTTVTLPDSANAFSGNIALDELFGVTGGLTYTAVSSAPDVVSVAVNGNVLTVTGLKMGNASVTVTGTDTAGASDTRTVEVTVTANPGGGTAPQTPAGSISLYPNPADDVLNIGVGGATGGAAGIRIYDAGARQVGNLSVTLDGNGVAAGNDVSGLAPGAYSVVVEHDGHRYTGSFMKR